MTSSVTGWVEVRVEMLRQAGIWLANEDSLGLMLFVPPFWREVPPSADLGIPGCKCFQIG